MATSAHQPTGDSGTGHGSGNASGSNAGAVTGGGGGQPGTKKAGAFDIRTLIAALIGSYGVVLTIMGLIGPSDAQIAKADGLNINLWAGLGMIAAAALFQAWAMWRPVVVPPDVHDDETADGRPIAH